MWNVKQLLVFLVLVGGCLGGVVSLPASGACWSGCDITSDESKVQIHIGPEVTLLGDGELGLKFFPDMQVALLQHSPTLKLILAATELPFTAHTKMYSYLLEGSDIQNLTSSKKILSPGAPGEFDNGAIEVGGAYKHTDGTWYAFYHAEDREINVRPEMGGVPGFYARIGLASSTDDGNTWTKLGPIISSNKPKGWTSYRGQSVTGATEPSVVVGKNSEYLYVYYSENSRANGRGAQICMARSRIADGPPLPGTWEKYYGGDFGQPGLGGFDTPVVNGQNLGNDGDTRKPGVVYSEKLDRYIMIINLNFWKELNYLDSKYNRSGIYFSYSEDGVEWSEPEPLIIANVMPIFGVPVTWLGIILWDEGSSTDGWLIYGYSPAWGAHEGQTPAYMVGRRVAAKLFQ